MATKKPNRTYHSQPLYLEPAKAEMLRALAKETRISKAALLREAVDDLLVKWDRVRSADGKRNIHTAKKSKS